MDGHVSEPHVRIHLQQLTATSASLKGVSDKLSSWTVRLSFTLAMADGEGGDTGKENQTDRAFRWEDGGWTARTTSASLNLRLALALIPDP